MRTPLNSALLSNLKLYSGGASWVVALFGCFGLAGWTFKIGLWQAATLGLPSVAPNTDIAFVLAGFSLWLQRNEKAPTTTRRTAQACAFAVMLIGALTLSEYLFNWKAGIDQLFFRESLSELPTPFPGR